MTRWLKASLFSSLAVSALLPSAAFAQQEAENGASEDDNAIIVTARQLNLAAPSYHPVRGG